MLVSIIVPCRNEKQHIRAFLASVQAQRLDPGQELEILVAEGMSGDGTRDQLLDYAAQRGAARLRVIDNPEGIVSKGLNAAILAASGEIVVRMDVHTTYAEDYIRECVRTLQTTGADCVGGPWVAKGTGITGRAIAAAFHSRFCAGGNRGHDSDYEGEVESVYLGCWKRSAFARIGLFDPDLVRNQDDELNFRLRRTGGLVWQSPRIRSSYVPRSSIKALFHQYLQYGFWRVAVLRKHRGLAAWRQVVPAMFVGSLLLGLLLAAIGVLLGFPQLAAAVVAVLAFEVLVYLIACILAAAAIALSLPFRVVCLVPIVMTVYHVSYGLGFLMGLVAAFLPRGRKKAAPSRLFTALTR